MKKLIPIVLVLIVLVFIIYRIATHGSVERAQSISEIQKEKGVQSKRQESTRPDIRAAVYYNQVIISSRDFL